jgi:hypothetical protein
MGVWGGVGVDGGLSWELLFVDGGFSANGSGRARGQRGRGVMQMSDSCVVVNSMKTPFAVSIEAVINRININIKTPFTLSIEEVTNNITSIHSLNQ